MSRSNKPKRHRKRVKNKYLQFILMRWSDDFGGTRKKDRTLSRLVRKREKKLLRKDIEENE